MINSNKKYLTMITSNHLQRQVRINLIRLNHNQKINLMIKRNVLRRIL